MKERQRSSVAGAHILTENGLAMKNSSRIPTYTRHAILRFFFNDNLIGNLLDQIANTDNWP